MKRFDKILEGLKYKSPLPLLYENGYTPETIKKEILSDFAPYFTDQNSLEKFAMIFMVPDWINFMRISIIYPNILNDIKVVLETYNEAKSINKTETIKVLADLMKLHIESGNKFWSFLNLEVPKLDLELEEFVQTSFKDISDIIEGMTKVLFIEQVLINKICRKKIFDINNVIENKIGNLIEELIVNSNYKHLFTTVPDNIKLSDWRNIAAHHNYSINKNAIICECGEKEKKKVIKLSREELFDRVNQCMRTTQVLSMAHKFFGFDNMDEIREARQPDDKIPRDEMKFLIFSSGIMSQGFEIIDIDYLHLVEATLVVQDLTNDDPVKRGIHSSQFLYNLWLLTGNQSLKVKYIKSNGELSLISKCCDEDCKPICSGQEDLSYLANKVEFEIINGA